MGDVEYILGHSESEIRRLTLQGAQLRPLTERLLRETGLGPGMRVLDVGCGLGDVAMLAAAIVGPSGSVVGVDRETTAVQAARNRAAQAGLDIEFHEATIESQPELGAFDLAIGRLVLVHQPDPASFMRTVAAYVRPGGVVAFQEPLVTGELLFANRAPLWHGSMKLLVEAFAAVMQHPDIATRLVECFHAAGLDEAQVFGDLIVDSGPQSPLYAWLALSLKSVLPFLEKTGAASQAEVDVDTLEGRLRDEAMALHTQVIAAPQFCGWVRKPQAGSTAAS